MRGQATRARRWGACSALVWAVALLMGGCGNGDDVPLTAPGASGDWPAEERWRAVPHLFSGYSLQDAAWDMGAEPGRRQAVIIAADGTAFACDDGAWRVETPGIGAGARLVASIGDDAYLVVGQDGLAWSRTGGTWRREETGTAADLLAVASGDGVVWCVGAAGTVLRREGGTWQQLPPPDARDLLGVAARADSVFVVVSGVDSLQVWDGAAWASLPPGRWVGHPLRGLHRLPDDRLVVAADSLLVRSDTGWQAAAATGIPGGYVRVEIASAAGVLAFRNATTLGYGWYFVATDGPVAGAVTYRGFPILGLRDRNSRLQAWTDGRVDWVESGTVTSDPAGRVAVSDAFPVGGDGLVLRSTGGIFLQGERERRLICTWDDLPGCSVWSTRGAGRSADDFWLVGEGGLFRILDGVVAKVADPFSPVRLEIAVAGDGVPYLAGDGIWRWVGHLESLTPAGTAPATYRDLWALGDGRVAARTSDDEVHVFAGSRRLTLGGFGYNTPVMASPAGRIFALPFVGELYQEDRRDLQVWVEQAGAFRSLGHAGLGALGDLQIEGGLGGTDTFFWTRNPCLVFALVGDPLAADWQLLTGAWDESISAMAQLSSGALLVLDSSPERLHLYRP